MAKLKSVFVCSECGYSTSAWSGKCPDCGTFNSLNEEITEKKDIKLSAKTLSGKPMVYTLDKISTMDDKRISTGICELDRVLSGGFVEGSLTLVGGEPGIGKSTLLLQVCKNLSDIGKTILYVSGEESISQIKLRAKRLGVESAEILFATETEINLIEAIVNEYKPDFLIIDSIQTIINSELQSSPGSVTQVRECTAQIMHIAKDKNVCSIIVGHVTKEGSLAGPRILEHMVDTVLYFEGEQRAAYRILRSIKNRFGATDEIGVFEMKETGLAEISNPSEFMLNGRPLDVSGSCVFCSIEGTRPIMIEVQALASYTNFGIPRRTSSGTDYNKMIMLIAVLEKRLGMQFNNYDVYLNIAGGMKITEPALDAAIIAACTSSYRDIPVDYKTIVFGEVGLAGELRAVNMSDRRIAEAAKLGFKQCILPQANLKGLKIPDDFRVFGCSNVSELVTVLDT